MDQAFLSFYLNNGPLAFTSAPAGNVTVPRAKGSARFPAVPKSTPAINPVSQPAAPVTADEGAAKRNRRRRRRGGKAERMERRKDPTSGKLLTWTGFMMKHAQGADFDPAQKLWDEAGALSKNKAQEEVHEELSEEVSEEGTGSSEQDPVILPRTTSMEKEESDHDVVAEERRIDPTNGMPRTFEEFLMEHALGADFSRGECLWENAERVVDDEDDEGPPPLLEEDTIDERRVRFADAESAVPDVRLVRQRSILKPSSRLG